MADLTELPSVLQNYPISVPEDRVVCLGNAGGFSGAQFWKLETDDGCFCLRRWPAQHPSPERLRMIHSVLAHVDGLGFQAVPKPILNRDAATFTQAGESLWELTRWLPGRADFHAQPTARRAENIMRAVATFHRLAATAPVAAAGHGPSGGIRQRLDQLRQLRSSMDFPPGPRPSEAVAEVWQHAARWQQILRGVGDLIEQELARAARLSFPLQPCIRDIWHDHILLDSDDVTGLVDFGAMRSETVAGDLARLLASLFEDNVSDWSRAIESYEAERQLSDNERMAIATFDRSAVLLSPYHWFRWLLVERREFERMDVILDRIRLQMRRLEKLDRIGLRLL